MMDWDKIDKDNALVRTVARVREFQSHHGRPLMGLDILLQLDHPLKTVVGISMSTHVSTQELNIP